MSTTKLTHKMNGIQPLQKDVRNVSLGLKMNRYVYRVLNYYIR